MDTVKRLLAPQHSDDALAANRRMTWGPLGAVFYTIVVYFVSEYGAPVVLLAIIAAIWPHKTYDQLISWLSNSPVGQFFTIAAIEAVVIVMLYLFLRNRKSGFAALGWWRKPLWHDLAYMFAGFGAYFVGLNFIIFPVIRVLIPSLNFNQKQDIGFTGAHGPILILVFVSLAILPPLVEETLVRGFLYTGLRTKVPIYAAAIITSIMFAAAHLELGSGQPALWTAAIDTFTLSLVLIYLRQKTDSLYASVGVHFLKNSLAFAALFIFHIT